VWLSAHPSFERLLIVELWLSFLYGIYNGAMVSISLRSSPAVRASGFSLAYSLATALFGGFTPAICTYLIQATGNSAMPGAWLATAAAASPLAAIFVHRLQPQAK